MNAKNESETQPLVIVLAAGSGTRFRASGGDVHKLDAPLSGMRVRDHVMACVRASQLPWHVVEREDVAHIAQQGMGWSIAAGVAATPGAAGWLILPADLPLVRPETLQAVARALREHEVVIPFYRGQRGHPVGFGRTCREALLALQGDEGARSIVQAGQAMRLDVDDAGCVMDVDTRDALERAQEMLDLRRTGVPYFRSP